MSAFGGIIIISRSDSFVVDTTGSADVQGDIFAVFDNLCRAYPLVDASVYDRLQAPLNGIYRALFASFQRRTRAQQLRVQILTEETHRNATRGVAAESGTNPEWYRTGTAFIHRILDAGEDMGLARSQLVEMVGPVASSVPVYTPKGKLINVPSGPKGEPPTILDFAACIHGEFAARVVSAKMGGVRGLPPETPLQKFAVVELELAERPVYDLARLELPATDRGRRAVRVEYGKLPREVVVAGGRDCFRREVARYLLEPADLEQDPEELAFARRLWGGGLTARQRETVLVARFGKKWKERMGIRETESPEKYSRRYGAFDGVAITVEDEDAPRTVSLIYDDIYYLMGLREIKAEEFVGMRVRDYMRYARRIRRATERKGRLPTALYRVTGIDQPGAAGRLFAPWEGLAVNIERQDSRRIAERYGGRPQFTALMLLSAHTRVMRLQIPRQVRLFQELPFVVRIERRKGKGWELVGQREETPT